MSCFATSYDKEALELLEFADKHQTQYLDEAKSLKNESDKKLKKIIISSSTIKKECLNEIMEEKQYSENKLLIFVSFSMPIDTLKSLYRETKDKNVILVLRGLKNGSFKETALFINEIGIGVKIDPTLFKKYGVYKVPTFVLQTKNNFYSLSGNVTLSYALHKFKDKGL